MQNRELRASGPLSRRRLLGLSGAAALGAVGALRASQGMALAAGEDGPQVVRRAVVAGIAADSAGPPLVEKIGQMVLTGFTGLDAGPGTAIASQLANYGQAGVVLFDYPVNGVPRNISSPPQLKALVGELLAAEPNLIVACDEEGGLVARLDDSHGFPATVSEQYLGTINDPSVTYSHAAQMGATLASMGINLNFAPVVDVNVNPNNPIIGSLGRSFSADPDIVTSMAEAFIHGMHDNGVLCTLKHFPGHGSSTTDSHLGFVNVTNTWSAAELEPFRDIIADGLADAVMTAHIFNANLDPQYPATLSYKTITGILREQLGWDGVVFSDAMEMRAITDNYGFEQAIVLAVGAGVDILQYGNDGDDPTLVGRVIETIRQHVVSGAIPESRIDESYLRVQALKKRLSFG